MLPARDTVLITPGLLQHGSIVQTSKVHTHANAVFEQGAADALFVLEASLAQLAAHRLHRLQSVKLLFS